MCTEVSSVQQLPTYSPHQRQQRTAPNNSLLQQNSELLRSDNLEQLVSHLVQTPAGINSAITLLQGADTATVDLLGKIERLQQLHPLAQRADLISDVCLARDLLAQADELYTNPASFNSDEWTARFNIIVDSATALQTSLEEHISYIKHPASKTQNITAYDTGYVHINVLNMAILMCIGLRNLNYQIASTYSKYSQIMEDVMDDITEYSSFCSTLSTFYEDVLTAKNTVESQNSDQPISTNVSWDDPDFWQYATQATNWTCFKANVDGIIVNGLNLPEDQLPDILQPFAAQDPNSGDWYVTQYTILMGFDYLSERVALVLPTVNLSQTFGDAALNSITVQSLLDSLSSYINTVSSQISSLASAIGVVNNNAQNAQKPFDNLISSLTSLITQMP
jgi:hypothetical protein